MMQAAVAERERTRESSPTPRVRMTRAERREAILECATRQFASRGYQQTTLAQIAAELGVTEPLIYKHFDGKEALFKEVFERVALFFVERIGAIVEEGLSPLETLRRIACFYFQHLAERPEFASVLYQVSVHHEPGMKGLGEPLAFLETIFVRLHDFIAETIRSGQAAGEIPKELDPSAAAWCFIGNYHILILLKSFGLDDFSEDMLFKMLGIVTGRPGAESPGA